MNYLTHLECSLTQKQYDADQLIRLSDAGLPLLARYDLAKARVEIDRDALGQRPSNILMSASSFSVPAVVSNFSKAKQPTFQSQ